MEVTPAALERAELDAITARPWALEVWGPVTHKLLSHIAFLDLLIHDLKEESGAYHQGIQEGLRQARMVETVAQQTERKRQALIEQIVDHGVQETEEALGFVRCYGCNRSVERTRAILRDGLYLCEACAYRV